MENAMLSPDRMSDLAPLSSAAADYDVVRRAIAHIKGNWRTQPEIEQIAEASGVTPTELHHLFRRWAGLTPKAFLQALTLDSARNLLRDSASVLDASYEVGLSGPGRLHDLFVTHEAMSPGEWKTGGEAFPLLGRQKTGDRKLAPARDEKQLQQSELLVLLAVEPGPERIQSPFRDLAAVTDLAETDFGGRHDDLLERRRGAVVGAERPIDQQHVEPKEADHGPGAEHEKEHAAGEAHATEQRHHQQEAAARQRAVRRDDRRKKRGLGESIVVGAALCRHAAL